MTTNAAGFKRYEKARHTILAPPHPSRPFRAGDIMFEEKVGAMEKPPIKERLENAWVQGGMWSLVDK